MPRTDVIFYQEEEEDVPVLDWLQELRRADRRAYESCVAAIGRLAEFGHELRRPLADILRDGIYELRIRKGRVNYRILYFFHGRNLRFSVTPSRGKTKCRKLRLSELSAEKELLRQTR